MNPYKRYPIVCLLRHFFCFAPESIRALWIGILESNPKKGQEEGMPRARAAEDGINMGCVRAGGFHGT